MNTPLIDIAEGRDQDNRSSLLAAFRTVLASRRRRELADLHVRELLTYVLATDRDGRGVQLSYDDIANALCCERSTARLVVSRAYEVYGLLAVIESRYVRGGQAPNRYSIDWLAVRRVRNVEQLSSTAHGRRDHLGMEPSSPTVCSVAEGGTNVSPQAVEDNCSTHPPKPGSAEMQGDASRMQGDASTVHPYKEDTLTLSLTLKSAAAAKAAAEKFKDLDWPEVCRRASQLARVTGGQLDRTFVWKVAVIAETLEPGWSGTLVTTISTGSVRKHQAYLDASLRRECSERGIDYRALKQLVPPPRLSEPTKEPAM